MRYLNSLALLLVIVGGLNWLLVGVAQYDLVATIAGTSFGRDEHDLERHLRPRGRGRHLVAADARPLGDAARGARGARDRVTSRASRHPSSRPTDRYGVPTMRRTSRSLRRPVGPLGQPDPRPGRQPGRLDGRLGRHRHGARAARLARCPRGGHLPRRRRGGRPPRRPLVRVAEPVRGGPRRPACHQGVCDGGPQPCAPSTCPR